MTDFVRNSASCPVSSFRLCWCVLYTCTVQCTHVQWSVDPGTHRGVHVTLDSCRPLGADALLT